MRYCDRCGHNVSDGAGFCPTCGSAVPNDQYQTGQGGYNYNGGNQNYSYQNNGGQYAGDSTDHTGAFHPQDIADNKVMAILSYIGIFVLVPIFGAKNSPFARFHANQGLVLCLTTIAYGFIKGVIRGVLHIFGWFLSSSVGWVLSLVNIVLFVFFIMGIIYAAQGRAKELPIIGRIHLLR